MPVHYPPVEIQADQRALQAIANGIIGIKVEGDSDRIDNVWLRDRKGDDWLIGVFPRDLCFKFEVFGLAISSVEELQARWRDWKPPHIPRNMPAPFRSRLLTPPPEPAAPTGFDRWPLPTCRVEILHRLEFIMETAPLSAGEPGSGTIVTPEQASVRADVTCEVAVGLLFSGQGGGRLLLAADLFPMALLLTREADRIDGFLAACRRTELRADTPTD